MDRLLIDQPLPAAVAFGHMLELVWQGRPEAALISLLASFDLVHAHARPSTLRYCWPFLRDVATYLLYSQSHLLPIPRVLRPLFATGPDVVIETIFYMRLLGMGVVAFAARRGTPGEGRERLLRRLASVSDALLLGQWVTLCVMRMLFPIDLYFLSTAGLLVALKVTIIFCMFVLALCIFVRFCLTSRVRLGGGRGRVVLGMVPLHVEG